MEDQPAAAAPNDAAASVTDDESARRRKERREQRARERAERRGSAQSDAETTDADDDDADPSAAPAVEPVPPPSSPVEEIAGGTVVTLRDPATKPTVRPPAADKPLPRLRAVTTPRDPSASVTPLPSPKPPVMPPAPKALPGASAEPKPVRQRAPVPLAGPARLRPRHVVMGVSFVLAVLLPSVVAAWYLWAVAIDQYVSRVGFSVQREETGSAVEILGGITELSGSSSTDTDILYKYIQSRELISTLNERLDLVAMFTRPEDPLYTMPADPTIEDVEEQWLRMVDIFYDTASYLIEIRVRAFTPEDARAITENILAESTKKLNDITSTGRADATRYAREELDVAKARLREARQSLTAFRIRTQIVDPAADVQGRMGLLNNLLSQQAMALIELDLVAATASPNDPRFIQAQRRVEVIEARLREERARFGDQPAEEDQRYAELVAEYEELSADLEFAQQAYLTSLATYDGAIAEAQRKSRYLATYLPPTQAERSQFPQRWLLFAIFAGAASAIWSIGVLVYYTIRDRI